MNAAHPLARMLTAFDARVRELSAMLGEASLDHAPAGAAGDPQAGAHAHALRTQAARRIWFATPVPLDAFLEPGNRVAIVAPEVLRRLLAARTLFACRDAVRRCVDRHIRRALLDGVGAPALATLVDMPAAHGGVMDGLPDDLSADALARDGWLLVAAEGGCRNPTLCNVIELSLASESDEPLPTGDITRTGARADGSLVAPSAAASARDETERFFSAVGRMFPELQWLFG